MIVPFSTKTKSPYANSPAGELSASSARVSTQLVDPDPTVVTLYKPFCFASVWFFTNTLSFNANEWPSITMAACVPLFVNVAPTPSVPLL